MSMPGSWRASTKIGTPSWWSPPQPPAGSKVFRPATIAPVDMNSSTTLPLTPPAGAKRVDGGAHRRLERSVEDDHGIVRVEAGAGRRARHVRVEVEGRAGRYGRVGHAHLLPRRAERLECGGAADLRAAFPFGESELEGGPGRVRPHPDAARVPASHSRLYPVRRVVE